MRKKVILSIACTMAMLIMAGFGDAIKNVGIGISSPSSKVYVHTVGAKTGGSIWYNDQDAWQEALADC